MDEPQVGPRGGVRSGKGHGTRGGNLGVACGVGAQVRERVIDRHATPLKPPLEKETPTCATKGVAVGGGGGGGNALCSARDRAARGNGRCSVGSGSGESGGGYRARGPWKTLMSFPLPERSGPARPRSTIIQPTTVAGVSRGCAVGNPLYFYVCTSVPFVCTYVPARIIHVFLPA